MTTQAQAWGGDARTRVSILVAMTVFVEGKNCPGWKPDANGVMRAVQSNGYLPEETLMEPVASGVRQWLGVYRAMPAKSACAGILKSFGPQGGHVPNLVRRAK